MKCEGFSVVHFNSRSLYTNLSKIKEYLQQLQHSFSVIAISESWLRDDKELPERIEGYEMYHQNRVHKRGGGVALYVKSALKCKVIKNMTTVIDNLLECITIEINVEKSKNILVSCIYRGPGTCITQFNKKVYELFDIQKNKVILVCGDFNIDLMKSNEHPNTKEFLDIMFSLSLHPLIVKPSRITKDNATLIDNIFTNVVDGNTISGLLVADMSDHLPVFTVIQMNNLRASKKRPTYLTRKLTPEAILALKVELLSYDWQEVYVEDTNAAYDAFLDSFMALYNHYCPLIERRPNPKKEMM